MGGRTNLQRAKEIAARMMIAHDKKMILDQSDADVALREIDISAFRLLVGDLTDDEQNEFDRWRAMRQVQLMCNKSSEVLLGLSNLDDLEQWAEKLKPSHGVLKVVESMILAGPVDDDPLWALMQQTVKDLLDEAETGQED